MNAGQLPCCTECGIELRPRRTTLAEYPGTRCAGVTGICSACYSAARRDPGRLNRSGTAPRPTIAATMSALDGWMKERQQRLVKKNGRIHA